MNKFASITVLALSVILVYTGCTNGNTEDFDLENLSSPIIEGLTFGNFPKLDGSTTSDRLIRTIICRLLGIDYRWEGYIVPNLDWNDAQKLWFSLLRSSQTHQAFVNLIDKEADLIITARKMSSYEKGLAHEAGVSLIETPIALDAFIFIINTNNPIDSLTSQQIQDIYTGKLTNWKDVGGNESKIKPFVRNPQSGSQEFMEMEVMKDVDIAGFPESPELVISSMAGAIDAVFEDPAAICYTFHYYFMQVIQPHQPITPIAINRIYPIKETIINDSYPYVAPVYAVIRSDLDNSSMAYKVYEWLQTESGKQVISESEYIPY